MGGHPEQSQLVSLARRDAIVRSIAAGATGYLQKYSGKEQLLATLREVAQGEFRIPGSAVRRLSGRCGLGRAKTPPGRCRFWPNGTGTP